MIRVDEPTGISASETTDLGALATPVQATSYKYDVFGKMVEVTQGVQKRWFKYDALGRLLRVRQPEQEVNNGLNMSDAYNTSGQWTAGFTYDLLGNVLTATDANGTVITNTYDKAARVTSRTYNDGTPQVTFVYDGIHLNDQPFAKGKLTKVTSSISETQYTKFDNFGRVTESQQRTPFDTELVADATARISKYTYNFAGALVEEEYPSGRKVTNEFEADGDLAKVTSKKNSTSVNAPFVSNFSYTASGGISQMKLGNGRWETAKFNNRMQVTELGLGASASDTGTWKTQYEYGELNTDGTVDTNKNTGNIAKQTLSFNGITHPLVQTYRYDALYRIKEATETANSVANWFQVWGYDLYGNRTSFTQNIGGNPASVNPTIVTATNRFDETGTNFDYDLNGNLVRDADGKQFTFNGDNKQTVVKDANNNVIGRYYYDGEGKRVKKITNAETTIFVYSSGKLVAEYSTATPPATPSVNYTTTDHLGSPRVITDAIGQVTSRRDFLPFGEEVTINVGARSTALKYGSSDDKVRQKFTGYQKDTETSLDFAEARMYDNRFGRFTAVDPLLASGKSANPQTFNRFVYVGNSPLKRVDPTGLIWGTKDRQFRWFKDENAMKKAGYSTAPEYYKNRAGNWIMLNPNGPNAQAKLAFDRNGWGYIDAKKVPAAFNGENMPSMQASNSADGKTIRLGFLFGEFATGTGEQSRYFGPTSNLSNAMRSSPEVAADREEFCFGGCANLRPFFRQGFDGVRGRGQFTWTGISLVDEGILGQRGNDNNLRSVLDLNESRTFIGSFGMDIRQTDEKTRATTFTVTNTMNSWSLGAHVFSERPFNPSTMYERNRPAFTTTSQTIQWIEINPCGCK